MHKRITFRHLVGHKVRIQLSLSDKKVKLPLLSSQFSLFFLSLSLLKTCFFFTFPVFSLNFFILAPECHHLEAGEPLILCIDHTPLTKDVDTVESSLGSVVVTPSLAS